MKLITLAFLLLSLSYGGTKRPYYLQLYRDYVFTDLSEKGQEMFFGPEIHPLCTEKQGVCMLRDKCVGERLYLSRMCYSKGLVCCYDKKPIRQYG